MYVGVKVLGHMMDTSFWAKIYVEVCHTSSNDRGSTQVFCCGSGPSARAVYHDPVGIAQCAQTAQEQSFQVLEV